MAGDRPLSCRVPAAPPKRRSVPRATASATLPRMKFVMPVAPRILGVDIWLTREQWESDALELPVEAAVDALKAFDESDVSRLRALWSQVVARR